MPLLLAMTVSMRDTKVAKSMPLPCDDFPLRSLQQREFLLVTSVTNKHLGASRGKYMLSSKLGIYACA